MLEWELKIGHCVTLPRHSQSIIYNMTNGKVCCWYAGPSSPITIVFGSYSCTLFVNSFLGTILSYLRDEFTSLFSYLFSSETDIYFLALE